MRIRTRISAALLLGMLAQGSACSVNVDEFLEDASSPVDASLPGPDAQALADAAAAFDSGLPDSGEQSDSGAAVDGGAAADVGAPADSGAEMPDATVPEDAGAGSSSDVGTTPPDAATAVDAGSTPDAAEDADTGPRSCGTTASGSSESRDCYTSATVPSGSTCTATTQTRTCDDGSWNPDFPSCANLSCSVAPAHVWDVTVAPPALENPTTITLPGSYLETITHSLCTGPGYEVYLDNSKDYIIRTTEVLTAPVLVYGGRNVRIIGIHIDLATAACGTAGVSGYAPGVIALMAYQTGTTFIEGAYIDVAGRSTDCIDPRNFIGNFDALNKGYSEAAARGARDVVIQNSVCRGMSGDHNVHGDVLQTQGGYELYRDIVFENVSADSNCEGTVLEPRQGFLLANSITMRRFDYRSDSRYTPNVDPYDGLTYDGGPVQHSAKSYVYDQVYLSRNEPPYEMSPPISGWVGGKAYSVGDNVVWGSGSVYGCITAGTSAATGGPTGTGQDIVDGTAHWKYLRPQDNYLDSRPPCNANGLFCPATPATDRFASPGTGAASSAWTGVNYVSPH